ncbi:MAG: hypothetical protein HUJ99_06490 [Bacteroidaceae bacterium]|nr:hypothetical protein [Bacteroidaceae bacterium]
MAKKPLTAEEIAQLSTSPHVAGIVSGKVSFTPEFKKLMYENLLAGKTIRMTMLENGIDPQILGDKRIWGIAEKLRANADREQGFIDLRCQNRRRPPKQSKEQTLAKRIEQLENELAYTRQEVEFLKKIRAADLEAQRLWESKHRRK